MSRVQIPGLKENQVSGFQAGIAKGFPLTSAVQTPERNAGLTY